MDRLVTDDMGGGGQLSVTETHNSDCNSPTTENVYFTKLGGMHLPPSVKRVSQRERQIPRGAWDEKG